MVDPNFSWIYLIVFLAIPLARIIPRLIARRRQAEHSPDPFGRRDNRQIGTFQTDVTKTDRKPERISSNPPPPPSSSPPPTKEKQVLGELHRGSNTFEKLQKNTGFDSSTLNSILEDLERDDLIKVVEKRGTFGPKVELYSTDKGFKEYYS